MSPEEASVILERETGYDSIPTIREHYRVSDFVDGRYVDRDMHQCVHPGCRFRRKNPVEMWFHVHFGRAHGDSFGVPTIAQAIAKAEDLQAAAPVSPTSTETQ